MKKIKVLYFLELQKLEKIKRSYFYQFWPPGRDIDILRARVRGCHCEEGGGGGRGGGQ